MNSLQRVLSDRFVGLVSVLLAAIFLVLNTLPVFAADGDNLGTESITLSPVSTRFQINAGDTKEDELTIVNDGSTAYDFIVYARPYSVTDQSYDPDFTDTPSNADAYQWVQFSQASWHIEAGATQKVPYTIRVPKTAAPGGHYGVIFAETQPKQPTNGTSVARKKRVGSIIYATVNGTYTTGGQSLGTNIVPVQFRTPLSADTIVENTGNADFEVQTTYRISDLFGNVKYENQKTYVLLPVTTRKMDLVWADAPWFGLFNVSVDATFLDQQSSAQKLVLLVPRWLLLMLGVSVVGGGVYVALRNHRR